MEEEEEEKLEKDVEEETVDHLTSYLRRTSRGRIIELPRWMG